MLTQTVVLPLVGKLGERLGQMRVFVGCVVTFTLGSLLCGLAPNIFVLILCRVMQALGGAGFMTSATAIVAREFPETRSGMIGLFASILSSSSTSAGVRSSWSTCRLGWWRCRC